MTAAIVRCLALLALFACAIARGAVLAQQQAPIDMDEATRGRVVQYESDLDSALVSASDPASLWLRGLLTRTDDEARTRDLAAAHRGAPKEVLYLASLASACQVNLVPRPAACAENDWIAKWASVDVDNAAPWMLLAARSLRIRQPDRAIADMVQASERKRYDEYWNRSAARAWTVMRRTLPSRADDASGALIVWNTQPLAATGAFEAVCQRGPVAASEQGRDACLRLASDAMARADTIYARRAAAAVVESIATEPAQKSRARGSVEDLTLRSRACSDWVITQAGAPTAPGATARVERWIAALDSADEATACDQQAR